MNACKQVFLASAFAAGLSWFTSGATAAEAMTAYTWEVLKANPRFYWNFDLMTNTGGAVDLVRGQANDTLLPFGNATTASGASANLRNTAAFDGDDLFAAADLADGSMPGAWAVEMWMQAEGSLDNYRNDYLLNAGTNSPALIYDFNYGSGATNELELFQGGIGRTQGSGPSVDDNDWHHVVATFYGNGTFGVADRVDFAIDGVVSENMARNGFSSAFSLDKTLFIGAAKTDGANGFQGKIDEVALYDLSGLTEAQVATRTAQLASHSSLRNETAATPLRYIDPDQITYSFAEGTGSGAYTDPGFAKLTDGVIGSTDSEPQVSGDWVGWSNVDPAITFDLGVVSPLDSVFIDYLVGNTAGVHAPDQVLVEFSMDGSDFASMDSLLSSEFNNFSPSTGGWNRRAIIDLENTQAQFVRLTFSNDAEWTSLSEVQFVVVPEPGTVLLLLSALAAVLMMRRQ